MRSARVVAATTLVTLSLSTGASAASAEPATSWATYQLLGAASGIRTQTVVPGTPASDELVGWSSPWSDVVVDSLGTSKGRAALGYPGAAFLSATGIPKNAVDSSPAGPALPSPPTFPLLAESSHPSTPEASAGAGPAEVQSSSTSTGAMAAASTPSMGASPGSTTTVEAHVGDELSVVATSTVTTLTVGEVSFTSVHSKASLQRSPVAASKPSATLEVHGATLAGVPIELVPGAEHSTPTTTIRYLDAVITDTYVLSPAMEIVTTADPSLYASGGPSSVITTVGESAVWLDARTASASATPAREPRAQPLGSNAPDRASASGGRPGPPLPRDTEWLSNRTTVPAPTDAWPSLGPSEIAANRATLSPPLIAADAGGWYLALVVAGASILASLYTLRTLGIRRTWT